MTHHPIQRYHHADSSNNGRGRHGSNLSPAIYAGVTAGTVLVMVLASCFYNYIYLRRRRAEAAPQPHPPIPLVNTGLGVPTFDVVEGRPVARYGQPPAHEQQAVASGVPVGHCGPEHGYQHDRQGSHAGPAGVTAEVIATPSYPAPLAMTVGSH
jgi:hypothetical protein